MHDTPHSRFVSHLEAAIDGTRFEPNQSLTTHDGRPIWVRYDLDAVRRAVRRDDLRDRPASMWRYRELLPLGRDDDQISLGETMTPLVPCPTLARAFDVAEVWIKDESRLPGGSFKARGMAMAVSMARAFGVTAVATPTAGNAGGALSAYAARAGMACYVFMPDDTPVVNQFECVLHGAKVYLVNGLISDCGRIVREGTPHMDWFDMSTLKEPYRLEGKKTMGLELADQLDWSWPEVVLYPTGGGTGLIGIWKAVQELAAMDWVTDGTQPRLVSCQSDGCAPIARAYEADARFAEPFENAATIASGLRVPVAVGDFMILDAVRASGGFAASVPDDELVTWMERVSSETGVALCPESAACFGVLERGRRDGRIARDERVVVFNTGAAQKYIESMPIALPRLDQQVPIEWQELRD